MKLSQWHDGSVKPVHVGVYERRYEPSINFCFFDGKKWMCASETIEYALIDRFSSPFQEIRWRGIVKDKK